MALEAPITKKRRLAGGTEVVVCKGETILKDKEKRNVSVCVGCGSHITDQYIMQVSPDLCWHASCLKCADCEQYLDESCTCFVRDGKTYCKRDYVRLFGTKCSRCGLGFCREDVVMRPTKGTVFHLNCFRCIVCNKPLVTGDEFAIREDGLFCRADHDVIDRSVTASPCQDIGSPGSAYGGTNNNNSGLCNNNNNNNQNSHNNNNNNNTVGSGGKETENKKSGRGDKSSRSSHKSDHKTTRVRTVLNEKQLHTLRTCYNANPRPDALMKEQLTEMTGLSPRVIRVWFQNKRCKDKKRSILMKQIQQQQEKNGGGLNRPLQGVPMVASSPVRHEPPVGMQGNPVEVQSYQTPWKALSEFAMQGDLDQPHAPFQQLMSSFDHMDPGMHSPPHHHDLMMHPGLTGSPGHGDLMLHRVYMHSDDMVGSVGSDFSGTPSEMSHSPISH
ncbi:insulin gene enhancer protein isl-1-like isoform X2 [Biomphalaria glabrata]|uniref:Insulin gene enhancer protein isl-1-like isoform X2 n=1 Tax=Biomphalaria glabrata TaxID=6526 RepID=A0A9W2YPS1_BIOGL|nr:insulin gene enhancer protein isl-1-like isoform X2 [Biomphalaria glabrata]